VVTVPSTSAAGTVNVQVVTSQGTSAITSSDQYTYQASAPTVTGVSPNSGSTAGGNSITITGTGFTNVSAVMFGTTNAMFSVNSATSITAYVPSASAAGTVNVQVVTSQGTSAINSGDQYNYQASAPTVTGLSPSTGTGSGGTSITITGTNFNNVTSVMFGTTAAASFTVNSPTSITAVSPSHVAGTVDVTVTAAGGTSATGSADQYVFTAPAGIPTVTSLGTSSGTTAGGTSVTILGTNLDNVTSVMFGAVAAQSFHINSSTSITAISSAESAGQVDVTVTNSAGTSAMTTADRYTFVSNAPIVTSLGTNVGTSAGGTQVTITGQNFLGTTAVYFGSTAATSFTVNSPTSITATAPAHMAGTVDVTVVTPNGTSATSSADQYAFVDPAAVPSVTGLSASSGPAAGGTSLTINGMNFLNVTGVYFAGVAVSNYTVLSSTSIAVTTPSGSGTVDVTVTTLAGSSATSTADQYTFTGAAPTTPTVIALDTSSGTTTAGNTVTIYGTGFLNATNVYFGSVAATSFTVVADAMLTAVAPVQAAGTVDITVQGPGGTSSDVSADRYTYFSAGSPPSISGLSSSSGSLNGGDLLTIHGSGFANASAVWFVPVGQNGSIAATGAVQATQFLVTSDASLVAVTPADDPGMYDVVVVAPAGDSAVTTDDQYRFVGAPGSNPGNNLPPASNDPTITSLSTNSGPLLGGNSVTITGTNLTAVSGVLFGTQRATSFVMNADGTVTAVAPGESAGTVDVRVVTLNGTTALTSADQYTFAPPPPPPTITGLSVAVGPTTGGAAVTISGTNLTQVTGVTFDGLNAQSFKTNSDGTITAIAPGHPSGIVDVIVSTTGGASAATSADQFGFVTNLPEVTALDGNSGFAAGGPSVTVYGTNLSGATGVTFQYIPADGSAQTSVSASYVVNTDGTLTVTAPQWPAQISGPTTVDLLVQTANGTSLANFADEFTYIPDGALPVVTHLGSTSGSVAGGGYILVSGSNFTDVTGVSFGPPGAQGSLQAASFQVLSTDMLAVQAPPAAAGTYDLYVTTGFSADCGGSVYLHCPDSQCPRSERGERLQWRR
jgi:hypothetical protein